MCELDVNDGRSCVGVCDGSPVTTTKLGLALALSVQIFEKPKSSPAIFRQIQSNPNCLQSNNITDSLLHLPINKDFRPLSPIDKAQLQKKLKDIKYLIIDEKSMLGLRQLSWIDDRLREAFPSRNEEFFGGLNILLVGDFFQLPPVLQKPLYYDKEVQGVEIKGRNAYRRFDKTVFLKVVQRQRGDDQEAFRTALGELRLLQLSKESWKLLSSRVQAKLDDREVARFVNALRVYATKDRVNEYNHYHLDRLSRPAIQVTAKNVGSGAAAAPDDKAGNLAKQIPICLGARLMLTSNLWQPVGLCNGARGTVYDIGWAPGAEPIQDPPCVIMMEFDKYNGPVFLTTPDGKKIVPILPVERDFLIGATLCTRTQFPLIVCYAITVHKSQSITEDMIVTDLSCRDFQTGLSYVAVSRVKTLEGLMLDAPFDRNHLIYASPPDEASILHAIQALQNDPQLSLRRAAKIYNVSLTTLWRRQQGILSQRDTIPKSRKLSDLEEQIIVQFILDLESRGFPPRLRGVEQMANRLLADRDASPVGKRWASNFVKRHKELKTHFFRKYDYQRAKCEDPTIIHNWFRLVANVIAKYGIRSDEIYNFDETGFMMGVIASGMVVTGAERRGRPKLVQPGSREWITVIQAINAEGWAIPPFIIGAGQYHLATWYRESSLPGDWAIATSPNGWTDNEIGLEWLKHFDRCTTKQSKNRYRLLILDGHESHHSVDFERYCKANKVITLCMPPHSSHLL
ncbi:ATP-dependent DNA helicase pif1 [Fusarium oxysporum f. sp. conglutinans]|nr:ATP-dependent DNA helicase pif1 [Fusarium oxysporum f. sp. conglutinans]